MSAFFCARCDNLRDADDGCEEAPGPGFRLICADCMAEAEDEAALSQPGVPDHG